MAKGQASKSVQLSTKMELPTGEWFYGIGKAPKAVASHSLYRVNSYIKQSHYKSCSELAKHYLKKKSMYFQWWNYYALTCAVKGVEVKAVAPTDLFAVLKKIEQNSEVLLVGAARDLLRKEFIQGHLLFLERVPSRFKTLIAGSIDSLQSYSQWLDEDDQFRLYKFLGDSSFRRQQFKKALFNYDKANSIKSSRVIQGKINGVRKTLKMEPLIFSRKFKSGIEFSAISEEEKKKYAQFKMTWNSKDYVAAMEDAVAYLVAYPGGAYVEDVKRRVRSALYSTSRADNKFKVFKKRMISQLKGAPVKHLVYWGNYIYTKGKYSYAQQIYYLALKKWGDQEGKARIFFNLGLAAYSNGDYETSASAFDEIIQKYAGSSFYAEALYRNGLVQVRLNQKSQALSYWERYLILHESMQEHRMQALYWSWVVHKGGAEKDKLALTLMTEYPLTYYGLRVKIHSKVNEVVTFEKDFLDSKEQKIQVWLTKKQYASWLRFRKFTQLGLHKEANLEFAQLPEPNTEKEKYVYAYLYTKVYNFLSGTILINSLWDEDKALINKESISFIYPKAFSKELKKYSDIHKIDFHLIQSLIKQESSFMPEAVSPAGAMGLMQLMPGTAREVKGRLKAVSSSKEVMLTVKTNIRFGSYYINRLIKAYQGHVPLALASYNVGIGNMRKWLKSRPETDGLQQHDPKDPLSELWVDELPWSETSFYIKAILRNLLVYRLEAESELSLKYPLWAK